MNLIKTILWLAFFSLIYNTSCQQENVSPEDDILPEKARLKRILLYDSVDAPTPRRIVAEYEYDTENRISKVTNPRYRNGEIVGTDSYSLYEYSSLGQLEIIHYYRADSSGNNFNNYVNHIYRYNNTCRIDTLFIEYPYNNNLNYYYRYIYDYSLLKIKELFNNTDELESYTIYQYDSLENLIKETVFGRNNSFTQAYSYTLHYYSNGLRIKSDIYYGLEPIHQRVILRTYDNNGRLIILESYYLVPSSNFDYVYKYEYYE